jgi:hypothetical protein
MEEIPYSKVPIVLTILYKKIKESNKGPIIKTSLLKEVIKRNFITTRENLGGDPRGLGSTHIYDLIQDLINFNLLIRINQREYEIREFPIGDLLSQRLSNKLKYLKKLKKSGKKIKENTFVQINKDVDELLDIMDVETDLRILDSKCEKRLKTFPF